MVVLLVMGNSLWGADCAGVDVNRRARVWMTGQLQKTREVVVGAERMDAYLPMLEGKRVALVCNQTSMVRETHLLDTLLSRGVRVVRCFAPEHGMRGDADAGAEIGDGRDARTGVEVASIYGKHKKPTAEQLKDVDVVVFDIQDVGARFYTYISTLHYVMEACGEEGKQVMVLDRPNPNDCVDGPVLDLRFRSFVGMDPIPVLHGCTVGELARMMNNEGWLANGVCCDLEVVTVSGWRHGEPYSLPVKPSPNLGTDRAVETYASLCLFEATPVSVGRGTEHPFEWVGYPDTLCGEYVFTPRSMKGAQKPLQEGKRCYGDDLRNNEGLSAEQELTGMFSLHYILKYYRLLGAETFFKYPSFFDKLAGTDVLRKMLLEGKGEDEIRDWYSEDLERYKELRKKYLSY